MAKKKTVQNELDEIIDEAKSGYDLRARLTGVAPLEETVTVYTDARVGRELGGAEDMYQQGVNLGRNRWGILGRVDEIQERSKALLKQAEKLGDDAPTVTAEIEAEIADLEKELKSLKAKIPALKKKLEASALVFTLRAVPDLVIRDARRKARANLDIKNKNIPDARQEEYDIEYTSIVLAASVTQYVDNADGSTHYSLTVDNARALRDLLPPGQFAKLDNAVVELSFKAQIGNHATDSADF